MNMYYVAQVLPPEINRQVLEWKQMFEQQYGCKVGLKSPAHITLVPPFKIQARLETLLLHQVHEYASMHGPFTLTTQGFAAFKPRTIFVAVQHSAALHQLKRGLEQHLLGFKELGIKKENRPFHPHITLATRDLEKQDFYTAWAHFEHQAYTESWMVQDISVLRHNGKNWDVLHNAPLLLPPEQTA